MGPLCAENFDSILGDVAQVERGSMVGKSGAKLSSATMEVKTARDEIARIGEIRREFIRGLKTVAQAQSKVFDIG